MPALLAVMDTTVGVVGLMVAIVVLIVAIAIFAAIQIAGEHLDNIDPRGGRHA
jgi:hypothetical protein